ncbi:GntR family transcriptional regulator [Plasticicumulans lactativorans]|uniref:GntR family transcriptional regulator n=1 Tax=Plasticicumulans lactativorans TaxID=1133106 RepID=A0A4R2L6Y1_9GAMM|nr:GntR family transcriptional regulator [Plasticicumulans lactativorans]TCO79746.1 GntR family transcriptional regulator [Plasticicumulans lactativorans]
MSENRSGRRGRGKAHSPIEVVEADTLAADAAGAARPGDQVMYEAVLAAVMESRLRPGMRLTEAACCEIFDLGRLAVRKALLRLAHEKLVDLRPNRGAVVASPTPAETREIYFARRMVETALMPLAVAAATPAVCAELRAIAHEEAAAVEQGERSAALMLSGRFHMRVAELAGNGVMTEILAGLLSRTRLIVALYGPPEGSPGVPERHLALVDAMEAGDVAGAVALMERHIILVEQALRFDVPARETDLFDIFTRR